MKKVLIIAASILTGIAAQATNVTWGLQSGESLAAFKGGTAYLVLNSDTGSVLSYAEDVTKASSFSSDKLNDTIVSSASVDGNGFFSKTEALTPTSTGLTAGMKQMYLVVFSSTGDSMAYLTATGPVNIQASTLASNLTRASGAFTTVTAVPEPCSVALLALGLAALGMKRKIA